MLVEDLEGQIRDYISAEMPTQPGYLEGKSLVHLMIDYRVWRGRFVQPWARKVHRSAELKESPKSAEHADGTPLLAVKEAQQTMWELDQCRKDPSHGSRESMVRPNLLNGAPIFNAGPRL